MVDYVPFLILIVFKKCCFVSHKLEYKCYTFLCFKFVIVIYFNLISIILDYIFHAFTHNKSGFIFAVTDYLYCALLKLL